MQGLKINEAVLEDELQPDGSSIPAFYVKKEDIPEDLKSFYKKINCEDKRTAEAQSTGKTDVWARVDVRNVLVIKGIPFYSSTGTSSDNSAMSSAWRKNVWMPFMGFEAHGFRQGGLAKLGGSQSESFKAFINELIKGWSDKNIKQDKEAFEDKLSLLYKKPMRSSYGLGQVVSNQEPDSTTALGSIIAQLTERFGSVDAFAYSMQVLPDDAWTSQQPGDYEEDFSVLRSLRDYFFKHYSYPKISSDLQSAVNNAAFEERNGDYGHVLETHNGQSKLGTKRISGVKDPVRKEQLSAQHSEFYSDLNRQLIELGADTTYLAQLKNPSAPVINTIACQLSALTLNLNPQDKNEAKTVWDNNIDKIINRLMPLEQVLNIE